MVNDISKLIMDAVEIRIRDIVKEELSSFPIYKIGIVLKNNYGIYTVKINGEEYEMKSKNEVVYNVNDVVRVLYPNGERDSSTKIIDYKI